MLEKKDDLIKNPPGGYYMRNSRQNNYDLLRILSTCAVILIHVNWKFFREIYQTHDANFYYSFESLLNILTRFSVPCFVMISGGFLLDTNKTGSYIDFYKQSFKKIFIPTIIAIVIQFSLYFICNINSKGKLFSGIINLINGNFNSLWYMYMLFPVYIMVPAIKILKSVLSKSAYCRISIFLSVWSIISQATSSCYCSHSLSQNCSVRLT